MSINLRLAVVGIAIYGINAEVDAAQLVGMSISRYALVSIDTATGQATDIGYIGHNIQDIAYRDLDGYLYGYGFSNQGLFKIDPSTGAAELAGPPLSDYGWSFIHGFAYDEINDQFFAGPLSCDCLLSVDAATQLPALVGDTGEYLWSLENNEDTGTLFSITGGSLFEIDPLTGATSEVGHTGIWVEGLAYDSGTGLLYAVAVDWEQLENSMLVTVDPFTAEVTKIGPIGTNDFISGLAFVPEPGCLLLCVISTTCFRRRYHTILSASSEIHQVFWRK